MPKIQIIYDKKNKQVKYQLILPKDVMEDFAAQQGDYLLIKSVVSNEITFKFKRKEEILEEKRKILEKKLEDLK